MDSYNLVKQIDPQKTTGCKKGRKSGGLLLYCKSQLKPFIKIVIVCNTHIWFEIDKTLFYNLLANLKVCAIYSPPESSNYYSDEIWEELNNDLLNITKENTPFLLIGDINARIGNISEFMQHEKINNSPPSRSVRETKRNNCDTTQNKKGMKLIELCKSYEMQIGNGRFPGDYWGNFTHHNKNKGASTVDLVLIPDDLFHITEDFKVLPHTELSDHSKIVITIGNTKKVVDSRTDKYKWLNKKQFINGIQIHQISSKHLIPLVSRKLPNNAMITWKQD